MFREACSEALVAAPRQHLEAKKKLGKVTSPSLALWETSRSFFVFCVLSFRPLSLPSQIWEGQCYGGVKGQAWSKRKVAMYMDPRREYDGGADDVSEPF